MPRKKVRPQARKRLAKRRGRVKQKKLRQPPRPREHHAAAPISAAVLAMLIADDINKE